MKKSSRSSAAFISRAAVVLLVASACACGPHYQAGDLVRDADACALVGDYLTTSLPRPIDLSGRATFDVEEYRVRGRFQLKASANGDAVLEFGGATLLGGHREDVVVSLTGDTLRVLDRERGRYYEGDEVERLVESGTHTPGDWTLALGRVLASGCGGVVAAGKDGDGLAGTAGDGPFELESEDGRITAATWPNPAPGDTFKDRLEVRYRWRNGALNGIEVLLPTRGWRVRLEGD